MQWLRDTASTGADTARRRRRPLSIVVLAVAMAVAACGSDGDAEKQRPLDRDEADRLAGVLFDNYDSAGATFTYTGRIGDDTLRLEGVIDFVTHEGRAMVTASGPESAITEVVWSESIVIERITGLSDALVENGFEPAEFVARRPEIDRRELDTAISVVIGMSSPQRDNPQLLQQTEGSAFLRTQEFRGREVEVLRFGERTSYWLDVDTGEMVRFEGNNEVGSRPRVVDIGERGEVELEPPPRSVVIDRNDIGELYDTIRTV